MPPIDLEQYLPVRKRKGRYFSPPVLDGPVAYHADEASGIVFASGCKGARATLLRATSKRPEWQRVLELPLGQSLSDPLVCNSYAYFCGVAKRTKRTMAVYRVSLRTWHVRDFALPAEAKGPLRITNVLSPGVIVLSETHAQARRWTADLIKGRLTALEEASTP